MSKPSIRHAAKLICLSITTVLRALNVTRIVSDNLTSFVLTAIKALGYSPNIHSRRFLTDQKRELDHLDYLSCGIVDAYIA